MLWKFANLFGNEYHGLAASLKGVNRRQQNRYDREQRGQDSSSKIDSHMAEHCANVISTIGLDDADDEETIIDNVVKRYRVHDSEKSKGVGRRNTGSQKVLLENLKTYISGDGTLFKKIEQDMTEEQHEFARDTSGRLSADNKEQAEIKKKVENKMAALNLG